MNLIRAPIMALVLLLSPPSAYAAANVYELEVDGLACPFCTYGVEKRLSTIEGVEKVDVELKKGVVIVTMTAGTALTENQAQRAVRDAGFTLRGFSQIQRGD